MKRSKKASLVLMGLTPLLISACDDTQKSQHVFASIDACTQAKVPLSSCQNAFSEAKAEETKQAPHYALYAQCSANYDADTCEQQTDNSGVVYWRPSMNGFLIARVIRDSRTSYFPAGPVFLNRDSKEYSPQYGTVHSGSGSGGNSGAGYSGGSSGWNNVPSDEVAGEGDTVSRGGFGGGEGEGGEGGGE
ncbi:DUF1190 domain-containing protein [Dyella monticola]|nr:DUF1190 domain-containing protein [Dyella monticola]